MNECFTFSLNVLRKLYSKGFGGHQFPPLQREEDPDKASDIIYNFLAQDKPCMIARFGSTEFAALVNYLGVNSPHRSVWKYIQGEQPEWWWNKNIMSQMQQWSGFFPPTEANMQRFGDLMMEDMKQLDLLGSWINNEYVVANYIKQAKYVHLRLLEPFWSKEPWTRVLCGKRVLVVHPFSYIIEKQYQENRHKLFDNHDVLPEFYLQTIRAVQSLGGDSNGFADWFQALDWMKHEIDQRNYDIALIGCGAYGFPLAAHVKRQGKKAVHLGGSLQLLFGIIGRRWEDPNYGVKEWGIPEGSYTRLINEYWVRPGDVGKPRNAKEVEGACYW